MKPCLTICYVSEVVGNSNARGESEGTLANLQALMIDDRMISTLTGVSLRRPQRKELQALVGPEKLLRRDFANSSSGLTFGPDGGFTMKDAVLNILRASGVTPPKIAPVDKPKRGGKKPKDAPVQDGEATEETKPAPVLKDDLSREVTEPVFRLYYDSEFGVFIPGEYGIRSAISTSMAYSTTDYQSEMLMFTGPNNTEGLGGGLAPYQAQVHITRYVVRQSYDLGYYQDHPHHLLAHLKVLLSGLPVGGNQTRNAMIIQPDVVMWRFSPTPGTTGLNHTGYETPVKGAPNLDHFARDAAKNGHTFDVAGTYVCSPEYAAVVENNGPSLADLWMDIFNEACKTLGLTEEQRKASIEQARRDGVLSNINMVRVA